MKKIFIIVATLIFVSNQAVAATISRTGKVTSVKMFSDVFVIYVDTVDNACGGNHNRVAIKDSDPLFSTVVSTALTAKATGATVEIGYLDQCTKNGISWDFKHFWLK